MILRLHTGPAVAIHAGTRLDHDLDMDFLDRFELCLAIEAGFAVRIPNDAVNGWWSVQDVVVDLSERLRRKERKAPPASRPQTPC